jgi:hypothetical protein
LALSRSAKQNTRPHWQKYVSLLPYQWSHRWIVNLSFASDDDAKNAHLKSLDGATERLTLLRGDLLDKDSLAAAFRGCEGVFHTASPVTDDPVIHYLCSVLHRN